MSLRRLNVAGWVSAGMLALGGCATKLETVGLVTGVAAAYGARAPSHEIEQLYYLGIFDPQDQLPPIVYRFRVHGQASFLSSTKFASGWVPAAVLDGLGSNLSFEKDSGRVKIEKADDVSGTFKTGRRLMLFGPEGFREAPANHRLVILMGSSPEAFFNAVDQSLGVIALATQGSGNADLDRTLFEALVLVRGERLQIDDISKDAQQAIAASGVKK